MVRETSIKCYEEIKVSGLLSSMLLQAYKEIADNSGICQLELIERTGIPHESLTPLPAKLIKMGLIYEVGKKRYKGRKRICYSITGKTKPEYINDVPKRDWKSMYFDAIKKVDELEQEVERLRVRKVIIDNNRYRKSKKPVKSKKFEQLTMF